MFRGAFSTAFQLRLQSSNRWLSTDYEGRTFEMTYDVILRGGCEAKCLVGASDASESLIRVIRIAGLGG